ncbi:MAG: tRNA (adenosine(37)-N6)-threonylcarbamoyltransferase complex dimerization subunit type 1 TsaB [Treponema sp. CETP13]|nr:MAG: tRNA (adenosine(37)-N6)-threonylcarbamoyltransferase complex dimerization subunit type 1 TsaB [Treponema sp. CETP13]
MKALAIDSASSCITFTAINEKKTASLSLNIGMHQSENLIPGIEEVMKKTGLKPETLEFACTALGPGSFTGLRLSFSALKAFQLAYSIPLYGIPSLEANAYPWSFFSGAVLSIIDAKKNRFYAQVFRNGQACSEIEDTETENVLSLVDIEENVLVCGAPLDVTLFVEQAKSFRPTQHFTVVNGISHSSTFSLLELGQSKYLKKEKGFPEYEGPLYIRKSEAELNLINS